MIKLENVVLASPEQMEFIIQGMRNPMNSWDKSDSTIVKTDHEVDDYIDIGKTDYSLMLRLSKAGTDHRKFMRMIPVYVRITAPLYWWKEFDTYKVGTVANSCSTMHKIHEKKFTLEDFSTEHLFKWNTPYSTDLFCESMLSLIDELNEYRELYIHYGEYKGFNKDKKEIMYPFLKDCTKKDIWWQMIQLLPSSYNHTRNVMLNYEVLANIYKSRKNHRLDEWREFCKWIEELPYSELIIGEKNAQ